MAKAFLIAAPWSNSGKTMITLGLARYLFNNNFKVQTFKCGPDYIDTIHHSRAAWRPSINLDTVMMSDSHLQEVFKKYSSTSDISIVEGVMGLFDGAVKDQGSSAEIAKKLDIPVILVVNAKAMAYTIAPILHGLKTFDPMVKIAGVLFNFVKTESHYSFLKEACNEVGIPSLGYIPPNDEIKIPSRHLGLHIEDRFEELINKSANHIGKHIDVNKLIKISKQLKTKESNLLVNQNSVDCETNLDKPQSKKRIAIAKDEAFTFTYEENLAYLKQLGNVIFFSPIHDKELPEVEIIYLAGGYPELYLKQLSENIEMKKTIKDAARAGVKILAECGGMMYLGDQIINSKGKSYSMVGVFDFITTMEHKKLCLGYRKVVYGSQTLWGHEFHYSSMISDNYKSIANVYTAREKEISTKVYAYKNVIATYIHLYWGEGNFNWFRSDNGMNPIGTNLDPVPSINKGFQPLADKAAISDNSVISDSTEPLGNVMNPIGVNLDPVPSFNKGFQPLADKAAISDNSVISDSTEPLGNVMNPIGTNLDPVPSINKGFQPLADKAAISDNSVISDSTEPLGNVMNPIGVNLDPVPSFNKGFQPLADKAAISDNSVISDSTEPLGNGMNPIGENLDPVPSINKGFQPLADIADKADFSDNSVISDSTEAVYNVMNPIGVSLDPDSSINKGFQPLADIADNTGNANISEETESKANYFITFTTAKSRISNRMVTYNSTSFIKKLDALIFTESDLEKMMKIFKEAFKRYKINVVCFNILPDHVHILLKANDEKELRSHINKIKGFTSFKYQRYKEWKRGTQKVWSQKFNQKRISKIDGSIESVINYIRNNHYKHKERWGKTMSKFIESLHAKEDKS